MNGQFGYCCFPTNRGGRGRAVEKSVDRIENSEGGIPRQYPWIKHLSDAYGVRQEIVHTAAHRLNYNKRATESFLKQCREKRIPPLEGLAQLTDASQSKKLIELVEEIEEHRQAQFGTPVEIPISNLDGSESGEESWPPEVWIE